MQAVHEELPAVCEWERWRVGGGVGLIVRARAAGCPLGNLAAVGNLTARRSCSAPGAHGPQNGRPCGPPADGRKQGQQGEGLAEVGVELLVGHQGVVVHALRDLLGHAQVLRVAQPHGGDAHLGWCVCWRGGRGEGEGEVKRRGRRGAGAGARGPGALFAAQVPPATRRRVLLLLLLRASPRQSPGGPVLSCTARSPASTGRRRTLASRSGALARISIICSHSEP
jgi:hypothetical protein